MKYNIVLLLAFFIFFWAISVAAFPVCSNNVCESGETFENCHQDCLKEGIEKYFPVYHFSAGEQFFRAT